MAKDDEVNNGEKSPRTLQVEARKKLMANIAVRVPTVRVTPADDDMRRLLKHPKGNVGFPDSGSAEWPLDQFTRRRISEGAVTREEEPREEEPTRDERRNRRQPAPEPAVSS